MMRNTTYGTTIVGLIVVASVIAVLASMMIAAEKNKLSSTRPKKQKLEQHEVDEHNTQTAYHTLAMWDPRHRPKEHEKLAKSEKALAGHHNILAKEQTDGVEAAKHYELAGDHHRRAAERYAKAGNHKKAAKHFKKAGENYHQAKVRHIGNRWKVDSLSNKVDAVSKQEEHHKVELHTAKLNGQDTSSSSLTRKNAINEKNRH